MVLKPILGYFLIKRKTRFSPYFIGVCELFTTTLFIFFTTATWILVLGLLTAFSGFWWRLGALFCPFCLPRALGKPSRRYLKRYLKFKN